MAVVAVVTVVAVVAVVVVVAVVGEKAGAGGAANQLVRQAVRSSGPRIVLCAAAKLRVRVEVAAGVGQAEEVEEEGDTSGKAVLATEGSKVLLAVRPAICLPTRRGD